MNKGEIMNAQQNEIKDKLLLDKIHLPKSVLPNSGYGNVMFTFKNFEIVDVKTTTTHTIEKENKKKFS